MVCGARDRSGGGGAARPTAVSVRGAGDVVAAGGGDLVRRRQAAWCSPPGRISRAWWRRFCWGISATRIRRGSASRWSSAAPRSWSTTIPATRRETSCSSRWCSCWCGSPALRCAPARLTPRRRSSARYTPSTNVRPPARVAVAEERARIARELHDIVAHAVSVMVLQVGAVRHKLPDDQREDRDALSHVEQAGRSALSEMRRLLDAMRGDDEDAELAPQPGLDRVDALIGEVGRAGLAGAPACRRRTVRAAARDRHLRVPDRPRGADQRAEARQCPPRGRRAALRAAAADDRSARRRQRRRLDREPTASATASSGSASA